MSTQDYVEQLDEDQLQVLIECARARQKKIQESGWVKLWVVSIGWANVAWFGIDDYEAAVARACDEVKKSAARNDTPKHIEMELKMDRFRPEEAAKLLRRQRAKTDENSK